MDSEEFSKKGKEMVDYIRSYIDNIESYPVIPDVEPGYLRPLLPEEAPQQGEDWDKIMADVVTKIMPGVTHWNHPRFHAYFPSGNSYPSILGDMLSDALGGIGFSWMSYPACTELEIIVMDWLAKAIGLPEQFLSTGRGGGVIEGTASECVLVCMIAARTRTIRQLKRKLGCTDPANCGVSCDCPHDNVHLPRLVAYCTEESHSCVEKGAKLACINIRILEVDENGCLDPETLRKAIEEDLANNLIPFFVSVTLGSTGRTSFDDLSKIGPVCRSFSGIWLHVDAAYAGSAFICPELRHHLKGIEYVDSFNTNANKWMLVAFDCSCLWVKDRRKLTQGLVVDPESYPYLGNDDDDQGGQDDQEIDYRNWGVAFSRRFRALKLWFVIRSYGIEGLQRYIRNHIALAKVFETQVKEDPKFEVMNKVELGLVCFRLIGKEGMSQEENEKLNQDLIDYLHDKQLLLVIPSRINGKFAIRFNVNKEHASESDIKKSWEIINTAANEVLSSTRTYTLREHTALGLLPRPFSCIRNVSKEMYERVQSKRRLYDGARPLLVSQNLTNAPKGMIGHVKDFLADSRNAFDQKFKK